MSIKFEASKETEESEKTFKASHFENIQELLDTCKMWIRDDDYDAYCRFFNMGAMEELLNELEKKDKIIDVMAEWIGDRCFYSDDYGNSCEIIQDSCYDPVKDCKNCIKQYFEKEVKNEQR